MKGNYITGKLQRGGVPAYLSANHSCHLPTSLIFSTTSLSPERQLSPCRDGDLRLLQRRSSMTLSWCNQMVFRLLPRSILLRPQQMTLRKQNFSRIFMMNVISHLSGKSVAPSFFFFGSVIYYIVFPSSVDFRRNLHMADFVTMLNGFCGIMSIFNSLAFCLSHPSDYTYLWKALAFLPAGLLADFFDGKVARWRGKSSLLGQELDSLADLVISIHFSH